MVTFNISVTEKQANLVNRLTNQLGFANRSEFFRALLRSTTDSVIVKEIVRTHPFTSPKLRSKEKIISAFKNTEKYSSQFLADLKEGLDRSDYFK